MDNKRLNKYLAKELRKIGRELRHEKDRCARLYPDWRDDEFNMLDNKFIWGLSADTAVTPSFCTWDDAYVYYNRATKKYYMTVDIGFYGFNYNAEVGRIALIRLLKVKEGFRNFLEQIGEPTDLVIFPLDDPALEADSLAELYAKFCIMYLGYTSYIETL